MSTPRFSIAPPDNVLARDTDPAADPPEAIDGLAYDPADNSLFYSSDLGLQVFNIDAVGGNGCSAIAAQQNGDRGFFLAEGDISGHAFDGSTLYLGQPEDLTGGPNTFPGPQILGTTPNSPTINLHFQTLIKPEDLAFDDVTFAPDCVVWANHVSTNTLIAYEVPCPCVGGCPADLDGDGVVGIVDFLDLLAQWGTNPGGPPDLNGDGDVDIVDFLALLANWGACPQFAMPDPPTLQDELDDACLDEDDYDDYVGVMSDENSSWFQKNRYDCWFRHYIIDCSKCSCPGGPHYSLCLGQDPFN